MTEFKEGDWVYWSGVTPAVGKIIKKRGDDSYHLDVNGKRDTHTYCYVGHLRYATPEEIIKAGGQVELTYQVF